MMWSGHRAHVTWPRDSFLSPDRGMKGDAAAGAIYLFALRALLFEPRGAEERYVTTSGYTVTAPPRLSLVCTRERWYSRRRSQGVGGCKQSISEAIRAIYDAALGRRSSPPSAGRFAATTSSFSPQDINAGRMRFVTAIGVGADYQSKTFRRLLSGLRDER
jgi:hypothetical protein